MTSDDGPAARRADWTALGQTAADPSATMTPEMLAHLATVPAQPARGPLPFALRASRLPSIDVQLSGREGSDGASDLVVRELLAEGGMGRVFLAEQRSLAREVAIKTVKDPLDAGQLDALLWEGAITGHLDHPGVTPVHLVGTSSDGQPILVMKRIVGHRWSDLLDGDDATWARFPMLPKDRLRAHLDILMEVARTIHFAHSREILHLDIKPDNVMIGELGEVYVVDWGIATKTGPGPIRTGLVGTPVFIAPEILDGTEVGPWTDVYLLGATLHLLLTGRPRHAGTTLMEVLLSAEKSARFEFDANVPAELAELANRATARDRLARPESALAFRAAIAVHLEHTASLALTRDGHQRLEVIDAAADVAGALKLATEARFAFKTALERWPENPQAREDLQVCLQKAAMLEIRRENLPGAKELRAELAAPAPELDEALRELETTLSVRAASTKELQRLRDEADLTRGSSDRMKILLGFIALGAIGISSMSVIMSDLSADSILAVAPPLVGLAMLGVATLRFRSVLANEIGRRLMATFFIDFTLMALHRATTLFFHLTVESAEVRSELLLVAAVFAMLAIFVTRRAWLLVAINVAGAGTVVFSQLAPSMVFNMVGFLTLAGLAIVFRRGAIAHSSGAGRSAETPK